MARKPKRVPTRLGIDEKAIRKGHHYETLVCDLERGTVEGVVDDRTQASLEAYFHQFTRDELATVDKVRRQEHKVLAAEGDERLKGTRYLWLWNAERIPEWRRKRCRTPSDA